MWKVLQRMGRFLLDEKGFLVCMHFSENKIKSFQSFTLVFQVCLCPPKICSCIPELRCGTVARMSGGEGGRAPTLLCTS